MCGLIEAEFLSLSPPLNSVIVDLLGEWGFAAWEEETTGSRKLKVVYSKNQTKSLQKALRSLQKISGHELKLLSKKEIKDEYYLENWSKYLKSFLVGKTLKIVPVVKDKVGLKPFDGRRKVVYIKPGLAFGTGSHPSTFLALELLEKYIHPGARVLDVGTGSGVLIIAAKKLGAGKAVAIDRDRLALENAVYNSKLNQIGKVFFYQLSISEWKDFAFDLVLANLNAGEIVKNFSIWKRFYLATIVFSGILRSEVNTVESLLSSSKFVRLEKKEKEDWIALVYKVN